MASSLMTTDELLDHGVKFAKKMLATEGTLKSMVYLHVAGGVIGMPFKGRTQQEEEDLKLRVRLAIAFYGSTGQIDGATCIAEGAAARYASMALYDVMPARLNPDRMRVMTIVAWGHDMTRQAGTFRIVPGAGGKPELADRVPAFEGNEETMKHWMDGPFQLLRRFR